MSSTINNPIPNKDFLNQTGFIATIEKCPAVSFFTTNITLPGVSTTLPEQTNPFATIRQPGDHATFSEVILTFIVSEDLRNWIEVYDWLIGMTFPQSFEQYKAAALGFDNDKAIYSDISVILLDNHKNPFIKFTYHDCLPLDLSSIDLTVEDTQIEPITATATFGFTHFTVEKLTAD